jgi:thiopeptide-type bacteriocin biosynthesis protein
LPNASAAELGQLFQADLIKQSPVLCLGRRDLARFLQAASLIQQTSAISADTRLIRFQERFVARYESRFVPLAEAVDADLGIGFDTFQGQARDEWIEDLVGSRGRFSAGTSFDAYDQVRLELLTHCLERGLRSCDLASSWLERFPQRSAAELPESFAVVAQLATIDGRTWVVAPSIIAPTAVATMARFCHADPALERAVRRHVEREQELAAPRLLADVAHFPNGHVANILLRPVLRSFEIPCGGKSGAPVEQQIPISDLFIGVESGRLALYSKRLGKQVSVRVTNAHNVDARANLPVYRFLGALQDADAASLTGAWSWGVLAGSRFLPRVVHGDVILCRASWRLLEADISVLVAGSGPEAFQRVQELRRELGLPRWISLQQAAASLVIDLDNCLSVEMMLHEVRGASEARIEELLPAPEQLGLRGPEGVFVGELVVPFLLRPPPHVPSAVSAARAEHGVPELNPVARRSFAPGSEWLYAKIYTGPSQLDAMVSQVEADVVAPHRGAAIDAWFFVPYADPDPHLRVRFHGQPAALLAQVLPSLQRTLESARARGVVWKLQLDTYEREIERYGGPRGIELAEQAFHADSTASLDLLRGCRNDAELRWQLAAVGIDRLLCDFGLGLARRERLVQILLESYRREFGAAAPLRKKIGADYRSRAERLRSLLWPGASQPGQTEQHAFAALQRRSAELVPLAARLRAEGALQVGTSYLSVVSSLAHMHAVRMLGINVRSYELVLYDYLRRQYATRRALVAQRSGGLSEPAGEPDPARAIRP